jgi:thiosulfate/3-mercaptopyruvate sulfurtransferase
VPQLGEDLRLAREPLQIGAGDRPEHLHRDGDAARAVEGSVHRAHPAATGEALDLETVINNTASPHARELIPRRIAARRKNGRATVILLARELWRPCGELDFVARRSGLCAARPLVQRGTLVNDGGREVTVSAESPVLVDVAWLKAHSDDPSVRAVEVDVDVYSYDEGHIPGAMGWNWSTQLCDTDRRDILSKRDFEALMRASGITPSTTIVLYGDNNNWFAAWAFWQLKIYGHADVRLLDGGRRKWLEMGGELTDEVPTPTPSEYTARDADLSLRAFLDDVRRDSAAGAIGLVDVRSLAEFTGEILAPPGLPETCQRGGHIPGASSIPWGKVCRDDGTFRSREELEKIYSDAGIRRDRPVVTYCRIGERSSHSWFALKYLLGYSDVRNYDGSWTEWGNLVNAPIEKG